MDFSKEQMLQIIEFIIEEDDCDTGLFTKFLSQSNHWGIDGFKRQINTSIKIFNLDDDDIDFFYHLYAENFDLILTFDFIVSDITKSFALYFLIISLYELINLTLSLI